jgi:single-strand DNA-binding protein
LATNEGKDQVSFHNIVCWDKQAELCAQYLRKGSKAFIEGKIQYDNVDKDGKKITYTKIIASVVKFLDDKGEVKPAVVTDSDFDSLVDIPF